MKVPIGLRTVKTAVAVIAAMLIVDAYGTSSSKLIFAMLGAMAAVQQTFKESVESCVAQIGGVLFGAAAAVLLLYCSLPPVMIAGMGIILVITLYNLLHIRFSPVLSCLIVVILCLEDGINPMTYAAERIWDTAIGLGVGLLVNMLVFPYDNSRQIRQTARSLDKELIVFLEEMFDGDEVLPDTEKITKTIDDMDRQLKVFASQKLFLRLRSQNRDINTFRLCEGKARELVARMTVLSRMEKPGALDAQNREELEKTGAQIRDNRKHETATERDVVTNYHIRQILKLRQELLDVLEK